MANRDEGQSPREHRGSTLRVLAISSVEVAAAIAAASVAVALLQSTAAVGGLGVLYLLAVLEVAIRRGEVAALVTAVLSVLTLHYLFITPRHQLTIAHSQDVVELAVLLIAAVVVGRLAAIGRRRAAEAESRAVIALAREREAALLARAAAAILGGHGMASQLDSIGHQIALAIGATHARVVLESVPSPSERELAIPLRSRTRAAWLYVSHDVAWPLAEVERLCEPLGRMIDVAVERERVAERAAETEAARRAELARTAVLHAISHDLRSPLTAITTAGSALRTASVTEAERIELLDLIDTEGARLARLVDDLLDLSRIEAGALAPRADWCDLQDVVASAAAHLQAGHRIEFVVPEDLPLVRADAAQLERVFSNLIDNAVKFSPPGSPVRVSAGVGGGRVTIRVSDHGPGIPRRHRASVFDPFFRVPGPGAGSGLGLAICRGFVEANGGQIMVQSERNRGSSFAVSFPLVRQPQPAVQSTP